MCRSQTGGRHSNREHPACVRSDDNAREAHIKPAALLATTLVRFGALGTALAASGALLGVPAGARTTAPQPPVPAAAAWPQAEHGVTPASLPDGTAYQPAMFLDAHTSVGAASTPDGKSLRL